MQRLFQSGLTVLAASMLASCGGGEADGSVSSPVTSTGVFRDAPVSRLYYETGGSSGFTGANGSFSYQLGKTYSFWVGNVKLGSVTINEPNATISPGSLVSGGTGRANTIANIARFLQTADDDANINNGISISESLDTAGKNWTQIDFVNFDLDGNRVGPLNSMNRVNKVAPGTYVSAMDAFNHLVDSMNCAYTGAFTGNRMSGTWWTAVLPWWWMASVR